MTYYILIALCVIVIFSYTFELSAKYTKLPGVLLLILTGILIRYLAVSFEIHIPDLSGLLPMIGTLGLILIVLEGSLDLTLEIDKKKLIMRSISSAMLLFLVFVGLFTLAFVYVYDFALTRALINSIPVGIISSAVAIPSAAGLKKLDREFVTYESSFSDIIGILTFDFVLINHLSIGRGLLGFVVEVVVTIFISVIVSSGLAFILHKIRHHVKYVIITAVIILVYSLAKLIHMPSLLVVLIFGLVMNNNHLFRNRFSQLYINFESFNIELGAFKHITGELTFLIRSFFFIIFGYYTNISELLDFYSLIFALLITMGIFFLRAVFFRIIRIPLNPLVFFAPRGLITILLFLSIPEEMRIPFMNQGLVTQVIFITILIMTFGNVFLGKVGIKLDTTKDLKLG